MPICPTQVAPMLLWAYMWCWLKLITWAISLVPEQSLDKAVPLRKEQPRYLTSSTLSIRLPANPPSTTPHPQRTKTKTQLARTASLHSQLEPAQLRYLAVDYLSTSFPTSYTDRRRHQHTVDSHTSLTTYTSSQLTASFASSRVPK